MNVGSEFLKGFMTRAHALNIHNARLVTARCTGSGSEFRVSMQWARNRVAKQEPGSR